MRRKRTRIALGVIAVALAATAALLAVQLASAGSDDSLTAIAKSATARFHDLSQAQAAGWNVEVSDVNHLTCIADPNGAGGMGIHWANPTLLGDGGKIDPKTPEALVYAPNAAGQPKLAALEYIMFASEWRSGATDVPPMLFGQQFFYNPYPNRFGLPAFWALHVWLWEPNPSGMFQPWNPRVSC
jgi:hypothetical protein